MSSFYVRMDLAGLSQDVARVEDRLLNGHKGDELLLQRKTEDELVHPGLPKVSRKIAFPLLAK